MNSILSKVVITITMSLSEEFNRLQMDTEIIKTINNAGLHSNVLPITQSIGDVLGLILSLVYDAIGIHIVW